METYCFSLYVDSLSLIKIENIYLSVKIRLKTESFRVIQNSRL